MTTKAQARDFIAALFIDGLSNAGITAPVSYQNIKFDRPENENWIRLTFLPNSGTQETLGRQGNRKFQRSGIITAQIFVPLNSAMATSDSLVEAVQRLFETNDIDTGSDVLYFFDVSNIDVGVDGAWYQSNVTANYSYSFIQ